MDLTGIENEAEFFPAGTLSDVLETELSDIVGRWKNLPRAEHPVERLFTQAETITTLLNQFRNTQDPRRRFELHRQLGRSALTALGYEVSPKFEASDLENSEYLPLLGELHDGEGQPALWLLEASPSAIGEDASDPLGQAFDRQQFEPTGSESYWDVAAKDIAIEELVADGIFKKPSAPRYVLVVGSTQLVLLDARKWPARSVLRFDLQEIFSRQDKETFQVMACLVSREARVPNEGLPLSDRLEEEAQRNANAVTTSLKKAVRDSIEILGQEVLEVSSGSLRKIDQEELTRECLRYMYRLLFLFYAESNPRLGILRLDDPLYASGYSVEALRDLESKRLRTAKERQGTFIWESLQKTLTLLFRGESQALRLPQIKVKLLDPDSTPILNSLKLRNQAVQEIIRKLSLRKTPKSTGRISYSKLGIGQLGAVYETLISFTGTIATEDLIEIKGDSKNRAARASDKTVTTLDGEDDYELATSRKDKPDTLAPSYFVPRKRIAEFNPDAVVFDGTRARIYKKGSFIYRLAGRDREKSASYYTPEPLARLLVKHVLMERCRDLSADEILELKVLEPAMGSAAFLVETTNQLADLYLERKQKELGEVIPQDRIVLEKQKVRSFIADRNCFGVDLNPIAVELGAISLWLNGLHNSQFSPWFGDQLHAGNSLVGARRAAYPASMLMAKGKDSYIKQPPEEFGWKTPLKPGFVWQWLLPADDMAAFDKDKSITPFAGAAQEHIKAWRRGGFFAPLTKAEINVLQQMTETANQLFQQVADDLAATRANANDRIKIWPGRVMQGTEATDFRAKEKLKAHLVGDDHVANTLPYKRLKTAMDAWCALWMWPLDKAELLPSRPLFLQSMARILQGGFSADGTFASQLEAQAIQSNDDLFSRAYQQADHDDLLVAEPGQLFNETNVEALVESFEWLKVAMDVAGKERFVHFDLIFADILRSRGGFDLIVGNPPWQQFSVNEEQLLLDEDPLPKVSSLATNKSAQENYRRARGTQSFITSKNIFPLASSNTPNLYRNFIEVAFSHTNDSAFCALIHTDGHLTSTKDDKLRSECYTRLTKHFSFLNLFSEKNFSEIEASRKFSLNIYGKNKSRVDFESFSNAYLARQVDESYSDSGASPLLSSRDSSGYRVQSHADRIVRIDDKYISTIARNSKYPHNPSFIIPFSKSSKDFIVRAYTKPPLREKLAEIHFKVGESEKSLLKNGFAQRVTNWQSNKNVPFIMAPCIGNGESYKKTPRANATNYKHYDVVQSIPIDYRPRSLLHPTEAGNNLAKKNFGGFYKFAFAYKKVVDPSMPRTLSGALIPVPSMFTDSMIAVCSTSLETVLTCATLFQSVWYDIFIKVAKVSNLYAETLLSLPAGHISKSAMGRTLLTSCPTIDFKDLMKDGLDLCEFPDWSCDYPGVRNINSILSEASRTGRIELSSLERNLAQSELDVLVARGLGFSKSDLENYGLLSPFQYEINRSQIFDSAGQLAFTKAHGEALNGMFDTNGAALSISLLEDFMDSQQTTLTGKIVDNTRGSNFDGSTFSKTIHKPLFQRSLQDELWKAWEYFDQIEAEGKLH